MDANGKTPDLLEAILGELADPTALERESHQRLLMRTLRATDMFVVLQPVASLRRPGVVGYEALVRSRGEGGISGGQRILTMARNAGLSHILDRMAWHSAILQARPVLARGAFLFLNFSPDSLYDPSWSFRDLAVQMEEAGGRRDRLVVEVVHSASVDLDTLARIAEGCRSAGVRLCLDDWTATQEGQEVFARIRPDFVKVDPTHFHSALWDRATWLLVHETVAQAHRHGAWVGAKGVERPEELASALRLGMDLAQGFYLGRPAYHPTALSQEARSALERAMGA